MQIYNVEREISVILAHKAFKILILLFFNNKNYISKTLIRFFIE